MSCTTRMPRRRVLADGWDHNAQRAELVSRTSWNKSEEPQSPPRHGAPLTTGHCCGECRWLPLQRATVNWFPEYAVVHREMKRRSPGGPGSKPLLPGGNTSMDGRSLIFLVAALLLFLVIVVFIVAYLFQPIPVE